MPDGLVAPSAHVVRWPWFHGETNPDRLRTIHLVYNTVLGGSVIKKRSFFSDAGGSGAASRCPPVSRMKQQWNTHTINSFNMLQAMEQLKFKT